MFSLVRVYCDEKGDSHFEDVSIKLHDSGLIGKLSAKVKTKDLVFREVEPTYDWDYHCAPKRQYIILLDGEIEIETSLGDKRTFKGGDILLMEDTKGKGHKTRNLRPEARRSIFITLP